jgi:hypothetical protein
VHPSGARASFADLATHSFSVFDRRLTMRCTELRHRVSFSFPPPLLLMFLVQVEFSVAFFNSFGFPFVRPSADGENGQRDVD